MIGEDTSSPGGVLVVVEGVTVEARKLHYDRPLIPPQKKEGTPA